jgi:hypothetical protein
LTREILMEDDDEATNPTRWVKPTRPTATPERHHDGERDPLEEIIDLAKRRRPP